MAALEQNSQESEKLMSKAREEKLQHLEDLHKANKKIAELEEK